MLASGSLLAYLVLFFSAVPLLSRGIFALKKSRSQQRREFLELWKDGDKSDDFWLELMIGHCFGRALPAALVRQVIRLPSAPAKLSDLSLSWSWLAYDTASARLHWREERRNRGRNSTIELRVCLAVYVMFAMIGILFTWKMPANSTAFLCGVPKRAGAGSATQTFTGGARPSYQQRHR